jgi:hypothetical protein
VHALSPEHATPPNWLNCAPSVYAVWRCQADPFQRSASAVVAWSWLLPYQPPAVHAVLDVHDTVTGFVLPPVLDGSTMLTTDQLEPFQTSASGPLPPPEAWAGPSPTVIQKLLDTHETPSRMLSAVAAVFGVGETDQADPFHTSASGLALDEDDSDAPTAMQKLLDAQEIP